MPTKLTNPDQTYVGVNQAITAYEYRLERDPDGNILLSESFIRYKIDTLNADGDPIFGLEKWIMVPYDSTSNPYQTAFKALHDENVKHARTNGHLAPGTDNKDFPNNQPQGKQ